MTVMRSLDESETVVLLNLLRKELVIHFSHIVRKTRESYKIQIPLVQIEGLMEVAAGEDRMSLILPLDGPSLYFRKLHNIDITFDDSRRWNERKTWYRQTDMIEDPRSLKNVPLELRKRNPIVDIGISFPRLCLYYSPNMSSRTMDNDPFQLQPRITTSDIQHDQREPL
jgi:hypothetical protein